MPKRVIAGAGVFAMANPNYSCSVVRCRDDDLCSPRAVWRFIVDDVVHGIYGSLLDMLHGSARCHLEDEDAILTTGRTCSDSTAGRTCGR